jgi:hypothetical protein
VLVQRSRPSREFALNFGFDACRQASCSGTDPKFAAVHGRNLLQGKEKEKRPLELIN